MNEVMVYQEATGDGVLLVKGNEQLSVAYDEAVLLVKKLVNVLGLKVAQAPAAPAPATPAVPAEQPAAPAPVAAPVEAEEVEPSPELKERAKKLGQRR